MNKATAPSRTPAEIVAAFDEACGTDVPCSRGYVSGSFQGVRLPGAFGDLLVNAIALAQLYKTAAFMGPS